MAYREWTHRSEGRRPLAAVHAPQGGRVDDGADKILRVIGRYPEAGLPQAREWMNSSDPALVQDAATVFTDIGGHEADLRAANAALRRRP
jgi:hypothetical protein